MLPVILALVAINAFGDPASNKLVKQLGSKSFRLREAAAKDLVSRGFASVPALKAGTLDDDAQIRDRCRQLLPEAAGLERKRSLAKLLDDPASPPPKGLAGLDRFLAAVGDNKKTRELYAAMMYTHFETLELADKDPKKAAEQYFHFVAEASARAMAGNGFGRSTYDTAFIGPADITFFLFAAADTRLKPHYAQLGSGQSYILFYGRQLRDAITSKESDTVRKLFLGWLDNETDQNNLQGGIQLATDSNMKEALPIMVRALGKKGETQTYYAAQAMIAVGRLGSKDNLKDLAQYLEDKTSMGSINFGNGKMLTSELRDVALGVSLHLLGEKRGEYGFDTQFGGSGVPSSYHYLGFPDNETRDKAFKKWKEFLAKKPEEKGKKDEPKAKAKEDKK